MSSGSALQLGSEVYQTAASQLATLVHRSAQPSWRQSQKDRPVHPTVDGAYQDADWPLAVPNERQHLSWPKGRKPLWLRQTFIWPTELNGFPLAGCTARLSLVWWAEHAQVYVEGQLVQEGDLFDSRVRVPLGTVQPGRRVTVVLRLTSPAHVDGALVSSELSFAPPAPQVDPGMLAEEILILGGYLQAVHPERLAELAQALDLLAWPTLPAQPERFQDSLVAVRERLASLGQWLKQRTCSLLGHAHLDMAWLWPVAETWQAAERTFQSVLTLQQDFPELIFCHSTPALYAWVEQHRPELFAQIKAQVQAGKWELVGGMWVEPDLNLPDGESLVRQVLYGQRYYQQTFGIDVKVAWVPDTFGFTWQLPQILKQGGLEYFVTQKLSWNDTTEFPHLAFWWQSPDGSRLFSYMSPRVGEHVEPLKMAQSTCAHEQRLGFANTLWLPGVGDHGGGPSRDMLEVARQWQTSPIFPQIHFTTAEAFLDALRHSRSDFPVWSSELYLEYHRGCYTTQAAQKRANRHCEVLLAQAEIFASLASLLSGVAYPKQALESAWKKVLFNQFHDILPGSSIPQVFQEANRAWHEAEEVGHLVLLEALEVIAAQVALPAAQVQDNQIPVLMFNSLNWQRSGWIDSEALPIPAVGYRALWLTTPSDAETGEEAPVLELENEYLRVTVDPQTGDLSSLFDKLNQRQVLSGPGNQLQAFKDEGQYWDAWNIDPNYEQHPLPPAVLLSAVKRVRAEVIEVRRVLGKSQFCQQYILEPGSPLLKIRTNFIVWQEKHVLVKAAFPLAIASDSATYEIPCAVIERSCKPQTDADQAKWEVPALRWASISDGSYGVSLLNNSKYGYDCKPSQLRLTLVRGPEWPDPEADQGYHDSFDYAIYPHAGDWRTAQTVRKGHELNSPLRCTPSHPRQAEEAAPSLPPQSSLLDLGADNLVLMTLKQAEDDPHSFILRCYESEGRPAQLRLSSPLPLRVVERVNLLEAPICPFESDPGIQAWQIASYRLVRDS